jgi:hypothetical protein
LEHWSQEIGLQPSNSIAILLFNFFNPKAHSDQLQPCIHTPMQCIVQYSAPLLFNWTWSALGQSCSIYFSRTWVLVLWISIHGFDFLHWNNLSFWIAWNRRSSLKLKHLFLPTNSDELPCYLESLRMPKFPYQQYWWTFLSCR